MESRPPRPAGICKANTPKVRRAEECGLGQSGDDDGWASAKALSPPTLEKDDVITVSLLVSAFSSLTGLNFL